MKDAVHKRIIDFFNKKNLSIRNLANTLKIHETTLGSKLKGSRGWDLDTICLIITHFEDLSAEWLLRGTGDMFLEKNTSAATSTEVTADERQQLLDRITQLSEEKGELKAECKYLRQELSRLTAINPDKKAI